MANILSIHMYLYLPSSHQVSYLPTYLPTYITYIIHLLIMLTWVVIGSCESRMVQKIGYQAGLLCTKHIYIYIYAYLVATKSLTYLPNNHSNRLQ
jgi:hypothetical protein